MWIVKRIVLPALIYVLALATVPSWGPYGGHLHNTLIRPVASTSIPPAPVAVVIGGIRG